MHGKRKLCKCHRRFDNKLNDLKDEWFRINTVGLFTYLLTGSVCKQCSLKQIELNDNYSHSENILKLV